MAMARGAGQAFAALFGLVLAVLSRAEPAAGECGEGGGGEARGPGLSVGRGAGEGGNGRGREVALSRGSRPL